MSRHRIVKNMNLAVEMEDEALSDGGNDMTAEEEAQFLSAIEQTEHELGPEVMTVISPQDVRDMVWEMYFDVEQSVNALFEEYSRRLNARERKGELSRFIPSFLPSSRGIMREVPFSTSQSEGDKDLPPIPDDASSAGSSMYNELRQMEDQPWRSDPVLSRELAANFETTERSPRPSPPATRRLMRVLSRSDVDEDDRLTVITEHTEEPELGRKDSRKSRRRLSPDKRGPRIFEHAINEPVPLSDILSHPTADAIGPTVRSPSPVSDTGSQGTVKQDPIRPTTVSYSDSDSTVKPRKVPIGFSPSEAESNQGPSIPRAPSPRKADAPSVKASSGFNGRPQSVSASSQSSSVSHSSVLASPSLSAFGSKTPRQKPVSSAASSTEDTSNEDRMTTVGSVSQASSVRTYQQLRPSSVSSAEASGTVPRKGESLGVTSTTKPLSKLALLAQAKAASRGSSSTPSLPNPHISNRSSQAPTQSTAKVSKLGLLAQSRQAEAATLSKANKPGAPIVSPFKPPKSHTTVLPPSAANGATMTTAITTTYHTPYTLARGGMSLDVPPKGVRAEITPSGSVKESKLAAKMRKSHAPAEDHNSEREGRHGREREMEKTTGPLFFPRDKPSMSPSPFASLLTSSVAQNGVASRGQAPTRDAPEDDFSTFRVPMRLLQNTGAFDGPSPDDVVFNARKGTSLAARPTPGFSKAPAKEREKALKKQNMSASGTPRSSSSIPLSVKLKNAKATNTETKQSSTLKISESIGSTQQAMAGLNIEDLAEASAKQLSELPKSTLSRERIIEEARAVAEQGDKRQVSIVVIGHVDAGKSTLMGRLLYELGLMDDKQRVSHERASARIGKSSFSWAWEMDGTAEERERGVTMDIATQTLSTPHRRVTVLDAPGHKDFVPNMISGATQADCALMVIDASTGEFESGFSRSGQSREHLVLVRSLGVSQVIVAVNKLDQVQWSRDRYDDICSQLGSFLTQTGFSSSRIAYVPVAALAGVNLTSRSGEEASLLNDWYKGPTLVDLLDVLEPPIRILSAPLRFPISNVFKSKTSFSSAIAVAGRVLSGIVEVGEVLRVLPGDESGNVRAIELDGDTVPWAAAGSNVTLYLSSIDPIHLNIGCVLCPPEYLVPLATVFAARIIVFDIDLPITNGSSVELFHQSTDIPATISQLTRTVDRGTGKTIKEKPRVLSKTMTAEVQISIRTSTMSGPGARSRPIPIDLFSVNKDMGRILLRRGGETIAAGIVLQIVE